MQHAHPQLAGLLPGLIHLSAQRSTLPPPVVHSTSESSLQCNLTNTIDGAYMFLLDKQSAAESTCWYASS